MFYLQGEGLITQTVFSPEKLHQQYEFSKLKPELLDDYALKITKKLQDEGHTAYLVGGCVRDLLSGLTPKDFDISTTARPRQIKRHIKNSFIIGRRFRLVLVKRGDLQYEVSTFRRNLLPGENPDDLPSGDNIFGSPTQDAFRRDYTCNALFYDPVKRNVIDYTGGLNDLQEGWLRLIGNPEERLPEDPIRILRAIRFSSKLNLQIEPRLLEGIEAFSEELKFSPLPRKREEFLKILRLKDPTCAFLHLKDLNILNVVLPTANEMLNSTDKFRTFLETLSSFKHELRVNLDPTELIGVFLWSLLTSESVNVFDQEAALNWIKDEKIQNFIKYEFGAFNTELTHIEQALRILPLLHGFDDFLSKGVRRQEALLGQKSFPLALMLYSSDPLQTSVYDWLDVYEKYID